MQKGTGLERNPHLAALHEAVVRFYRAEIKQGTATVTLRDLLKTHLVAYSTALHS